MLRWHTATRADVDMADWTEKQLHIRKMLRLAIELCDALYQHSSQACGSVDIHLVRGTKPKYQPERPTTYVSGCIMTLSSI